MKRECKEIEEAEKKVNRKAGNKIKTSNQRIVGTSNSARKKKKNLNDTKVKSNGKNVINKQKENKYNK